MPFTFSQTKKIYLLLLIFFVAYLFYAAFQYYWLADFPIGDDVVNHTSMAKSLMTNGFADYFKSSLYPFSTAAYVAEYRVLQFLFDFSLERTFIFTLCFNMFLVAILAGLLSFEVFKDYRAAILAMFLTASSRWLNDSLRMGVMAETFGWVIFSLCYLLLIKKKWVYLLPLAVVLLFFHPIPFGILGLTVAIYEVYWLATGSRRKRIAALGLGVFGIIIFGLMMRFFPDVFQRIFTILKLTSMSQGERSLPGYVFDIDPRRSIVYLLAIIGTVFVMKQGLKSEKSRLFLIFAVLSLLVAFKQWFGIIFLGSRFYFYFEFAVAIMAALGLSQMLKLAFEKYSIIIFVPIALMIVNVNLGITKRLTVWQLTDFAAGSTLPKNDRQMMDIVVGLIEPKDALVYSNSAWGRWLIEKGARVNYGSYKEIKQEYEYPSIQTLESQGVRYLYFSSIEPRTKIEDEENNKLDLIIDKDGVRLYELK